MKEEKSAWIISHKHHWMTFFRNSIAYYKVRIIWSVDWD